MKASRPSTDGCLHESDASATDHCCLHVYGVHGRASKPPSHIFWHDIVWTGFLFDDEFVLFSCSCKHYNKVISIKGHHNT